MKSVREILQWNLQAKIAVVNENKILIRNVSVTNTYWEGKRRVDSILELQVKSFNCFAVMELLIFFADSVFVEMHEWQRNK